MSPEMSPEQRLEWWNYHAADATDNELITAWAHLSKEERRFLWANFTFRQRMKMRIANLNEWGNIAHEDVGLPIVGKWLLIILVIILVISALASLT